MLNIFRITGDLSHLASILILLYSIEANKSIEGLSLKTHSLYVLVFVTRYLDLFTKYISLYNTLMKLFFLVSSIYTVYLMTYKYEKTIKQNIDTFPARYLTGASFVLSLIFTYKYTPGEVLWSFSLWLEAFAILPQLFILQRTGEAENITVHYIAALGLYRALYIPNWIYRYYGEGRFEYIAVLAGVVQTVIYSDFFYIYYTKVMKGKKFSLPV
ncbi:ER lumen protein-retaining receptor [[Candida] anglica]|uniref:ER lumen protein-retaining receptor n=1 Tax=[Candida] anglica TaxID=148631 RepID=A0ABP0EAS0_9ASCO